jgi:hypothetical protein
MDTLLAAVAVLGVLLMIIGRYIMIRDTGGDLPLLWIVALRLIPFSELVYMVRHYAQAKRGGIMSIVGMWLLVPWIGTEIWQTQEHIKKQMANLERHVAHEEDGEDDDSEEEEITPEMLAQMPAEVASFLSKSRDARLVEKTRKVEQMNVRLKWWFDQLQAKRATVPNEPEAVKRFTAEADAYSTYNGLAREANEELLAMQSKRKRK